MPVEHEENYRQPKISALVRIIDKLEKQHFAHPQKLLINKVKQKILFEFICLDSPIKSGNDVS